LNPKPQQVIQNIRRLGFVAYFPIKTTAKYYHLSVWAQGQVKWAKLAQTSSTYDVTHKKTAPPNHKNFLFKKIFFNEKKILVKYIWFKIKYIVFVP